MAMKDMVTAIGRWIRKRTMGEGLKGLEMFKKFEKFEMFEGFEMLKEFEMLKGFLLWGFGRFIFVATNIGFVQIVH